MSDVTDCTMLCVTTRRMRSQRKKERSDETSRFIDAAPMPPSSVRWRIHARMSSVVAVCNPAGVSGIPDHARNCSTS